MCLKESFFIDCWYVSSVVSVMKNVGERATAKNYCPVTFPSVFGKIFEKLVNKRVLGHLQKCGLFFISSIASGLPGQLHILWQLHLV